MTILCVQCTVWMISFDSNWSKSEIQVMFLKSLKDRARESCKNQLLHRVFCCRYHGDGEHWDDTFTSFIVSAHPMCYVVAEGISCLHADDLRSAHWHIMPQLVPAVVYIWLFTLSSICCIEDSYYSLSH